MRSSKKHVWRPFLLELAVYAIFLLVYFLCVLHFLGGWLKTVFEHDRAIYAGVAILLVIGQAFGLEILTGAILRWLGQKTS
ncbi:MAG TPA: hypothetical protein VGD78_02510 [Chthoniobacterales bacterium]